MNQLRLGPKLRSLGNEETINSFECWRNNIVYSLRLDGSFSAYLKEGFEWGKKTKSEPNRKLIADTDPVKSVDTKCAEVDILLEQIANYVPLIARNDIVKDCASLNDVWQKIRLFYNIQTSGSLLNSCWNIKRNVDESPQALYARIKQAYDDNLLKADGLIHTDGKLKEDEEMSPTLLNTVILHWLQILHPQLRDLVSQKFATELRNSTYAYIFPEISKSVDNMLKELDNDASVSRSFTNAPYRGQ